MSRVETLLTSRLEELACVLERSGAPSERVGRLLELASVATLHAVTLDLLTAERAETIWRTAKERHPVLETEPELERFGRIAA
jgi:hypothetical protein